MTDTKARTALEQRRAALLKTQADAARAEKERKFAVRYHKVKFFGAALRRRAARSECRTTHATDSALSRLSPAPSQSARRS